ncbi:hypothetical protein PQ610_06600 [Tardisphaera miroshnichenkoae]
MEQKKSVYDDVLQVMKALQGPSGHTLSPSQINQWLEYAFNTDDKDRIFIFIMRQAARQHLENGARKMIHIFQSENMGVEDIRKFLGLLKWLLESEIAPDVLESANSFQDLIARYSSGG